VLAYFASVGCGYLVWGLLLDLWISRAPTTAGLHRGGRGEQVTRYLRTSKNIGIDRNNSA